MAVPSEPTIGDLDHELERRCGLAAYARAAEIMERLSIVATTAEVKDLAIAAAILIDKARLLIAPNPGRHCPGCR